MSLQDLFSLYVNYYGFLGQIADWFTVVSIQRLCFFNEFPPRKAVKTLRHRLPAVFERSALFSQIIGRETFLIVTLIH